ncbi:endolytic transglycosylase MltG [Candidatus Microgenomates bacterium]|nr:endolytic transglycosylase MltG [Candidatus Microgenomates bacterium]
MFKKFIFPLIIIVLLIFGFGIYTFWNESFKPVSTQIMTTDFVITKGSGAIQIASKLQKTGLIKNALVFRIYTKLTGLESKIQAGQYELSPSMSLIKIVNELVSGPKLVWVTIPEGLRREEILQKFIDGFKLTDEEEATFRQQFLALTKNKEGYLFPDTYLLPKTTTAEKAVNLLTSTFTKKTASVGNLTYKNIDQDQVITMASLLERETFTDEEKPIVAGIIMNRLENGWPLQIDATIQYAMANRDCANNVSDCSDWWPQITRNDIEIKSAYNTYKNVGLPPTPISSPGLETIKAVLNPQSSDYFFYMHDTKGVIHYAKTLEDHNANVRKYLGK